jgi:hypothetical protein
MIQALATSVETPTTGTVTAAEAAAMLRAVFNLFARWEVSDAEGRRLLGGPSPATFYRWKRGEIGAIPGDTVWRLADLMGVHKGLRYLFEEPSRVYAWVRKPNLAFGGKSALDRMLAGAPSDITAVRSYLDAERAAW